jgi:glycerol-3-phosphate cytidylyltransferase-like family protein
MAEPIRVYVDMVGDLFHPGHVALLRAARDFGGPQQ